MSRISADCQQKLLFTKRDTSGRFLLVTFLEKQKREITCLLESGRHCIEIKSSFREIRRHAEVTCLLEMVETATNVTSTAIATTFTTVIINTNIQPQVQ